MTSAEPSAWCSTSWSTRLLHHNQVSVKVLGGSRRVDTVLFGGEAASREDEPGRTQD